MPTITTAYAKNIIRRAMREVVDPSPPGREINLLWEFFESSCAYCGVSLSRKNKEGHVDHLKAASLGGVNHISNRVLSCAPCNEKEKLDQDWELFLRGKNLDEDAFSRRRSKILAWVSKTEIRRETETLKIADRAADRVATFFDEEVAKLRRAESE